MAEINNGGPAFPVLDREQQVEVTRADGTKELQNATVSQFGLTIRDWFAGQALCGMIAANDGPPNTSPHLMPQIIARGSYMMADAMLAAREAKS